MAQTQEVASYHLVLTDQRDDGAANYDGVRVYDDSRPSEPPAALREGEWSEWMSVTARGERLAFKLRLLEVSESRVAIYATPLFQSTAAPIIPFTYPAGLSNRLSREIGQYVVEGAGWLMCEDEVLLDALYEHVADVAENHLDASTYLLAAMPEPGLFVHLFTETDRIQHAYWRFHEPSGLEDTELVARHGDKVRRMMSETDERIGKLLEYADEDTVIAVVSDHGFRSGPASGPGAHSVEGIYVFAGKGIEPASAAPTELDAASFHRATVVDVTPTLLYLLGYPAAKDMDGRALVELADEGQRRCCPLRFVDSYESGARAHDGERQEIDDATREQLKSLGYVQ